MSLPREGRDLRQDNPHQNGYGLPTVGVENLNNPERVQPPLPAFYLLAAVWPSLPTGFSKAAVRAQITACMYGPRYLVEHAKQLVKDPESVDELVILIMFEFILRVCLIARGSDRDSLEIGKILGRDWKCHHQKPSCYNKKIYPKKLIRFIMVYPPLALSLW